MTNLTIDYNNPVALRKAGLEALSKELGPLGMALFMRQYDSGYGDYTAERDELLKDVTLEEIERELNAM
ncbi:MAG: hypothetical protein LBN43_02130 [Oscillospiraceae bacterium]|jgi:hypothetical protein|nr:hypothetical protein [Oscillospiraceae bacterium]